MGVGLIGFGVLMMPDPKYANVVSIQTVPEYQNAVALDRAWSLPVASLYKSGFEFQKNPSFCGPASLVKYYPLAKWSRLTRHHLKWLENTLIFWNRSNGNDN